MALSSEPSWMGLKLGDDTYGSPTAPAGRRAILAGLLGTVLFVLNGALMSVLAGEEGGEEYAGDADEYESATKEAASMAPVWNTSVMPCCMQLCHSVLSSAPQGQAPSHSWRMGNTWSRSGADGSVPACSGVRRS